jgi:hypothetical protein
MERKAGRNFVICYISPWQGTPVESDTETVLMK